MDEKKSRRWNLVPRSQAIKLGFNCYYVLKGSRLHSSLDWSREDQFVYMVHNPVSFHMCTESINAWQIQEIAFFLPPPPHFIINFNSESIHEKAGYFQDHLRL